VLLIVPSAVVRAELMVLYHPDKTYVPTASADLDDNLRVTTTLKPMKIPTKLDTGGTKGLLADLDREFGKDGTVDKGWSWKAGGALDKSQFVIVDYSAIATKSKVGGTLTFFYAPGAGDPVQSKEPARDGQIELHWIQRVVDNHNITDKPGHGNAEDTIDFVKGGKTPFYDISQKFDSRPVIFQDGSDRPDPNQDHDFTFELYLASHIHGDKSKEITIYDGITWGWSDRVVKTPEPSTLIVALAALALAGTRFGRGAARMAPHR